MDSSDLFKGLSPSEIEKVKEIFLTKNISDKTIIRDDNKKYNEAFFLKSGTITVIKRSSDDEEIEVENIDGGSNTLFSLTSLVDGDVSITKLIAKGDCEIFEISSKNLDNFCKAEPDTGMKLWKNISNMLAKFLRRNDNKIAEMYKTLEEVI